MNQQIPSQRTAPGLLGATPTGNHDWSFLLWAPSHGQVRLHLLDSDPAYTVMHPDAGGYHSLTLAHPKPGAKYMFELSPGHERPDPASRRQPQGVHGPSEIVDTRDFSWTDTHWKGIALEDSVFYELHVGTFTPHGTFKAIIPHLDSLADLGITTIELMPIAQFPGNRNWGYDGVYPYAVHNSYGSPRDLQELVDAAHARGLAVALDVVYNHLGPEGNYLRDFAPYFTEHYKTPWGAAINFDGPHSDHVRRFFIQNSLYWLENFHFDALRLDAIHGIFDASATPFLAELSTQVQQLADRLGRKISLIAESDLNDARVLRPVNDGGLGMDSQWSDDFHHSVHTLLTGERTGYYEDFGDLKQLSTTLQQGWFYDGKFSPHRLRRHGNSPPPFKGSHFVVCTQNHDQIGNRALGERLGCLVDFESLKLAAAANLLSPFVPLLFMGEEYGDTAPFRYFTSHGDPALAEAVRRGRTEEFRSFDWQGEVPDPQAESTFCASRLRHELAAQEPHRSLRRFYQALLRCRKKFSLGRVAQPAVTEFTQMKSLQVLHSCNPPIAALFNFATQTAALQPSLTGGVWNKVLDSSGLDWLGPGSAVPETLTAGNSITLSPRSAVLFQRESALEQS
jgi:maltooligosyltrehalose trehalohydrolase